RISYMIADAKPRAVITTENLIPRLKSLGLPETAILTAEAETAESDTTDTNPKTHANQDTLAYVIYTSGSTGKPKGTMVAHRAIVNRVVWLDRALAITEDDRIIQKTPYGFDVSVGEIFLPLVAGATLIIARPAGHIDVTYLANLIREERATIAHFVAPVMEASLAVAEPADYASMRFVMCSGQALPRAAQDRFEQLLPHIRMHNLYGPTEAAVEVTHWPCDSADPRTGPGVPIGRPIDNVTIYILDDALNPVPTGVPGHLYIGGVALARGYLNRPDLTAGAFVPDPFGPPGARMYRSGDRARYLPNGAVDYLGRSDEQMKVRGVRIEPGEIEAAILSCGFREAAVLAGPDASGEMGVLAYVVAPRIDEADLREALSARLPDHMMPSAFMAIPALPLTPNGKLDRKALPAFDFTAATEFVPPTTPTQIRVAAIWGEVLGREQIGITDNFFKLGGQSLKAVTALNRIRQEFSVELGLEKAFALQTVGMLARHIDGLQAAKAGSKAQDRKTLRI
ncbi:amino acid adenylation domain-containing protein, partial [Gemmobacter serpentinus]|uniref:amino acid adenylation domain-containing protein n=1 Tax=Gemmobacter serpentinus TaxID=2652247 RepID=UPI00124F6C12